MVATIELFASILLSIMAVIVPVLALLVLCGIGFWAIKMLIRRPAKKPSPLSA